MKTYPGHYVVTSPAVSARMQRIKSKNTGLERAMERILRDLGVKFERQPKLVGHPDFRVRGTNVLIFCDSSFWHGRRPNERRGKAFARNKHLWTLKLASNRLRDVRISRALRRQGWSVQRFWDTDILHRSRKVKTRLVRIMQRRRESLADG